MKRIFIFSALSLSMLAALPSLAQEADSSTVTITAPKYRIEAPEKFQKMWPEDYRDYIHSYSLSNGMTLKIFNSGSRMYAEVDDMGRHAIVATAPNTFVAPDRQLKMTINLIGDDDATGELLMVVPGQSVSQATHASPSASAAAAPVQRIAQAKPAKRGAKQALAHNHNRKAKDVPAQSVARASVPEEKMLVVAFR